MRAPDIGMSRKAQSAAIPGGIASICLRRGSPEIGMHAPRWNRSAVPYVLRGQDCSYERSAPWLTRAALRGT